MLEEEIGIRIFERTNKGIKLTEEGKVLQTSHGANYDGYSGIMSF